MFEIKHVLVPIDFGESSGAALDVAVELAKSFRASLTLVHTCEIPTYGYTALGAAPIDLLTPVQDAARRQLEGALAALRLRFADARATLRLGIPVDEILAVAADMHADLIVMGTHGRRGLSHFLIGSVAERVVRMSPVPVLTVRQRAA